MTGKYLRKIIRQLLVIFGTLKKTKYTLLITRNEEKERWHYRPVKKFSALFYGITSKHKGVFIA